MDKKISLVTTAYLNHSEFEKASVKTQQTNCLKYQNNNRKHLLFLTEKCLKCVKII